MNASVLRDVELLLQYGADPSIKDFDNGVSCLRLAHAFPAANRLFGKYRRKDAVKERETLREEMGGSLKRCVECGADNSSMCSGCIIAHYSGALFMIWYKFNLWPNSIVRLQIKDDILCNSRIKH